MPQIMSAFAENDGLAAEFVLGTLDADEHAHARSLLAEDEDFAAKVKVWERRLGELHLMVEPVEPEAKIWARIKAKMSEVQQKSQLPEAEIPPPAPAAATTAEPPSLDAIEAAISQATTTLTSEAASAAGTEATPVEITWLLAAVAKGDRGAFERLYNASSAKLYGVVLRIVRRHELSAEVMEQAYLEIRGRAGEFNPAHSSPIAWMVAIARRLAIDLSRRPQAAGDDREPEVIDESEGPATVPRHQLTDDLKRLLTCIGRLEPDRQRMLLLAYYGAFSRDQLSTKLDVPVDLLKVSVRRSLLEVEQCLKS